MLSKFNVKNEPKWWSTSLRDEFLILVDLSMKCWNTAFSAQGSRVIIVVVQVGAVQIYVAAVEAHRENERGDETQFTTKIGGQTSLGSSNFVL
jgi:hypothetical protein